MFKKANFTAKNKDNEFGMYSYEAYFEKREFIVSINGIGDTFYEEMIILDYSEYIDYLVVNLEKKDLPRYKLLKLNMKATSLSFEDVASLIYEDIILKISQI